MEGKNNLGEQDLKNIAEGVGADPLSLWQCVTSDEAQKKVDDSVNLMKSLGAPSAPVIFVNNMAINTDKDVDIESLLSSIVAANKAGT